MQSNAMYVMYAMYVLYVMYFTYATYLMHAMYVFFFFFFFFFFLLFVLLCSARIHFCHDGGLNCDTGKLPLAAALLQHVARFLCLRLLPARRGPPLEPHLGQGSGSPSCRPMCRTPTGRFARPDGFGADDALLRAERRC